MATRLRALQGALVVLCAALLASLPAWAQHAGAPAGSAPSTTDRLDRRPPHLVVAAYVTPGSPLTPESAAAHGWHFGGTIYFAVYHNTARGGDVFGVRDGFDAGFVPGKNGPAFDVGAQFLYLYQVVNDRAFHDPQMNQPAVNGIVPAAGLESETTGATADIAGFALALMGEPQQITSWGRFTASAFAIRIPDTDHRSDRPPRPTPLSQGSQSGDESPHSKACRLALSAHPAIADALPTKDYRPWPAKRLLDVAGLGFVVGGDRAGLDALSERFGADGGVGFAAFAETAKEGGVVPDLVQIAVDKGPLHGLPGVSGRRAVFRADWHAAALAAGRHSVVFGYTSNLPPVDTIGVITERTPAMVAPVQTSAVVSNACPPLCCTPTAPVASATPTSRIVPSSGIPTPGERSGFTGGGLSNASRFGGGSVGGTGLGLFSSFPGGLGGGPPGGGGGGPGDPNTPPRNNPPGGDPPTSNPPGGDPPAGDPPGGDPPGGDPPGSDPPGGGPPVVAPAPGGIVLGVLGIPVLWYLSRRRQQQTP